jgi:hypothetical protein
MMHGFMRPSSSFLSCTLTAALLGACSGSDGASPPDAPAVVPSGPDGGADARGAAAPAVAPGLVDASARLDLAAPVPPDARTSGPEAAAPVDARDAASGPDAASPLDGAASDGARPPADAPFPTAPGTGTPSDGGVRMTWQFTNQCRPAPSQVSVRLYDTTGGGGWPGTQGAWRLDFGQGGEVDLLCARGHRICFGAYTIVMTAQGPTYLEWGVGMQPLASCRDCCHPCAEGTQAVVFRCF